MNGPNLSLERTRLTARRSARSVDKICIATAGAKRASKPGLLAQALSTSSDFLICTQGKSKGLGARIRTHVAHGGGKTCRLPTQRRRASRVTRTGVYQRASFAAPTARHGKIYRLLLTDDFPREPAMGEIQQTSPTIVSLSSDALHALLEEERRQSGVVFDPWSSDLRTNPYPCLHTLRATDPVHWSPLLAAWLLTRLTMSKRSCVSPTSRKTSATRAVAPLAVQE
jgi:hypothetical protein